MADDTLRPGDLVFLTLDYENYVLEKNPTLTVPLSNRLAKLEEIIDWESDKGKKIKAARVQSGKWKDLPLEDNKYIFSIYYHDLAGRKGEVGVIQPGVPLFGKNPKTGKPFFTKAPDWLFREIAGQCKKFNIEWKNEHTIPE